MPVLTADALPSDPVELANLREILGSAFDRGQDTRKHDGKYDLSHAARDRVPTRQHLLAALPVNTKVAHYRRQGSECRSLAKQMSRHDQREQLLKIAETWDGLAQQRESRLAKLRSDPRAASLLQDSWRTLGGPFSGSAARVVA
jgi:hypothetical protein